MVTGESSLSTDITIYLVMMKCLCVNHNACLPHLKNLHNKIIQLSDDQVCDFSIRFANAFPRDHFGKYVYIICT